MDNRIASTEIYKSLYKNRIIYGSITVLLMPIIFFILYYMNSFKHMIANIFVGLIWFTFVVFASICFSIAYKNHKALNHLKLFGEENDAKKIVEEGDDSFFLFCMIFISICMFLKTGAIPAFLGGGLVR